MGEIQHSDICAARTTGIHRLTPAVQRDRDLPICARLTDGSPRFPLPIEPSDTEKWLMIPFGLPLTFSATGTG